MSIPVESDAIWRFDSAVAASFVDHARCHIPNYDLVIDKAVDVCRRLLTPSSAIIDVGCATGETLRRLARAGFGNLRGVDSSPEMLAQCAAPGELILSDSLPPGPYGAVICNWTLHFVADKSAYLRDIYHELEPGGILFLSDKTSKDPTCIDFYHDFKRRQGVSDQEIALKARRLESVMHIDPPTWYLAALSQIGFESVHIVDASWCFTTFYCRK